MSKSLWLGGIVLLVASTAAYGAPGDPAPEGEGIVWYFSDTGEVLLSANELSQWTLAWLSPEHPINLGNLERPFPRGGGSPTESGPAPGQGHYGLLGQTKFPPPLGTEAINHEGYSLGQVANPGMTAEDFQFKFWEFDFGSEPVTEPVNVVGGPPDDLDDTITAARDAGLVPWFTFGIPGEIDAGEDVDMFGFRGDPDLAFTFELDPGDSGLHSALQLFDADGNKLGDPAHGQGVVTLTRVGFPDDGEYFLGVSGWPNTGYSPIDGTGDVAGSTGSYELDVVPEPSSIVLAVLGALGLCFFYRKRQA